MTSPNLKIRSALDKMVLEGRYDSDLGALAWVNHARREGVPEKGAMREAMRLAREYENGLASRGLKIHHDRHLCNSCKAHARDSMLKL